MACDRTPARGWMGVAPLDKGLSRSDWGLRWEGPSGPHRSVSEVSCKGTEAVEVPAERSGAACPTGAVTVGDWGLDRQDFFQKSLTSV